MASSEAIPPKSQVLGAKPRTLTRRGLGAFAPSRREGTTAPQARGTQGLVANSTEVQLAPDAEVAVHTAESPSTDPTTGPARVLLGWTRWPRLDVILMAIALVGGTVLRLYDLGRVGLNSDEAVYAGQAASLAGNPHFVDLFPVVRAHPLLFQALASPFYASGTPDVPGRYLEAVFGMGTVVLVCILGSLLYSRRVGVFASVLLAFMPYHVVISRQILLDGPMTFFATAALVCLAALGRTSRGRWLVAAGAMLGVAALTKETAVILTGSVFVFLSLVPRFWRPWRYVVLAVIAAVGLALMFPVITALSGGSHSGQSYFLWQMTRAPNHDFWFYLTTVPQAMGLLVLLAAVTGLVLLRAHGSWREVLLASWIIVPFVFFEVWPVKGYPYLLLVTPAIAVLAARVLAWLTERPATWLTRSLAAVAVSLCVLSLVVPALRNVTQSNDSGLAGAGGSPGGREAGLWMEANLPAGVRVMTIGPSMANILQFYSGRRSDGLSVSPNPLHRNPSYAAIPNPDAALRAGEYQFVVWDAYSAMRSPHFAAKELELVRRFNGRVVHTELGQLDGKDGQPVVVVYWVHP